MKARACLAVLTPILVVPIRGNHAPTLWELVRSRAGAVLIRSQYAGKSSRPTLHRMSQAFLEILVVAGVARLIVI